MVLLEYSNMPESNKDKLIEDVSAEIKLIKLELSVIALDDESDVEISRLYEDILKTIQNGLKGPHADKNFELYQESFEDAVKAREDNSALLGIRKNLRRNEIAEKGKDFKERLAQISTPPAGPGYGLWEEYARQVAVVEQLQQEIKEPPQEVIFNPMQSASKAIEEELARLESIAEQLAEDEVDYHTKMIAYWESLNPGEEKADHSQLDNWSEHIEYAKQSGFLRHCSSGLSQLLTRMYSGIQNFISKIKTGLGFNQQASDEPKEIGDVTRLSVQK